MITLSLDNLTKVVATQGQADKLIKLGYSVVSGSAESVDETLASTQAFLDSTGGNNTAYRGDGCVGELDGGLLHLLKTATAAPEMTPKGLELLRYAYERVRLEGDQPTVDFTNIKAVTKLPDIAEAAYGTLYLLTEVDMGFPVGLYLLDYDTFTALEDFDPGRAAAAALGKLSAAYDNGAGIVVDDVSSQSAIEAIILARIQAEIKLNGDSGFNVSFVSSTWEPESRRWIGKIKLTYVDSAAMTYTDAAARTWTIGVPAEGIHAQISAAYAPGASIVVADYSSKAAVEAAILPLIQAGIDAVDDNFTVSFVDSSYETETHVWTGKIKTQDEDIASNSFTDAEARTWTITQT